MARSIRRGSLERSWIAWDIDWRFLDDANFYGRDLITEILADIQGVEEHCGCHGPHRPDHGVLHEGNWSLLS